MLTWLQICWRAMLFVPSSICLGIFPVIIACWIGLCVVLCGVLCLVAIIRFMSSGLLNPLFFDYNFFCKPQNIVPKDNTANYWSVLSVQSRRSIKCCDWQAPPRATPDQPSPCVAVPSCAILSSTNTNAYTKTNTTRRPECFCFCYGSSTYGMIALSKNSRPWVSIKVFCFVMFAIQRKGIVEGIKASNTKPTASWLPEDLFGNDEDTLLAYNQKMYGVPTLKLPKPKPNRLSY